MRIVSPSDIDIATDSAGIGTSFDIADASTACFLGAAVIGAGVVVASVGVTTMAAPAVTLVPLAGATTLAIAGNHIRDNRDVDAAAPAAA